MSDLGTLPSMINQFRRRRWESNRRGRERHIEDIGYVYFYECFDNLNIGISIEVIGHFSLVRDASPRPLGFRSEIVIDPFYTVCRLIKVSPYRLSVNSVATHHIPEI